MILTYKKQKLQRNLKKKFFLNYEMKITCMFFLF